MKLINTWINMISFHIHGKISHGITYGTWIEQQWQYRLFLISDIHRVSITASPISDYGGNEWTYTFPLIDKCYYVRIITTLYSLVDWQRPLEVDWRKPGQVSIVGMIFSSYLVSLLAAHYWENVKLCCQSLYFRSFLYNSNQQIKQKPHFPNLETLDSQLNSTHHWNSKLKISLFLSQEILMFTKPSQNMEYMKDILETNSYLQVKICQILNSKTPAESQFTE